MCSLIVAGYIIIYLFAWAEGQIGPYKFSVIDYREDIKSYYTPGLILEKNSEQMANLVSEAVNEGSQMVIFPERSYSSHDIFSTSKDQTIMYASNVPEPAWKESLCRSENPTNYKKSLIKMSCAALQYEVNIVMHVLEKISKTIFNTYVVFDKNGTLVSKCQRKLYTDKWVRGECQFTVDNRTFFILSEHDLLRKDFTHGNQQNVIVLKSGQDVSNYTMIPSITLYEELSNTHDLNLLVSKFSNDKDNLSGSGIFMPNRKRHNFGVNAKSSTILSEYIRNDNKNRFSRSGSPLDIHRVDWFLNKVQDVEIKRLDPEITKYCIDDFCCTIKPLDNYIPRHFRVALIKIRSEVTKQPKFEAITEQSFIATQFCGIVYCESPNSCGKVPKNIEDDPNVEIKTNAVDLRPLVINHELNYMSVSENCNSKIIVNTKNTLLAGLYSSYIDYKIPEPLAVRRQSVPDLRNGTGKGQDYSCLIFIGFITLYVFS